MSNYWNLSKDEFLSLPTANLINFNNIMLATTNYKINLCREMGIKFEIRFLDIDDTLNKTKPVMQKQIRKLDRRVTDSYYNNKIKGLNGAERRYFSKKYFYRLDEFLEERKPNDGRINYDEIHKEENLYPNTVPYLNTLTKVYDSDMVYDLYRFYKEGYDVSSARVIFHVPLTHYNVDSEVSAKIKSYYGYDSKLDGIIFVRFYEEKYKEGKNREMSNKGIAAIKTFNLTREEFARTTLIENSDAVREMFMSLGGYSIKFLSNGYPNLSKLSDEEKEDYSRFNCERMITSIEPEWIEFVEELNRYDRSHGIKSNNYSEVDEKLASKVFKKTK